MPAPAPAPAVPLAALAPAPPVASLALSVPVAAPAVAEAPAATEPPPAGLRQRAGEWLQAGRRVFSSPAATRAAAAAVVPVARVAAAALAAPAPISPSPFRHPWIIMEAYHELRAVIRMYTDRTYRPSIYAWTIPAVMLSLMVCSYFFFTYGMPLFGVGPFLDRIVDLVLAYFAYKVMVREAERHVQEKAKAAGAV
jgi:hypothetical protein